MSLGPSSGTRHELTRHRRAVVAMTSLSATIPQYPLFLDVDLEVIQRLRNARDERPSYSDIVTVAVARLLRKHPNVNASFADDAIVEHDEVNIGLALDAAGGLMIVVIHDADRRSLDDVRAERVRLNLAAAEGRLRADDISGGTFAISNLGPAGIHAFQALLVPPMAAILAVGAIRDVPRARDGVVSSTPGFTLCLTCDHRVLDGAHGARFLRELGDTLEDVQAASTLFEP